MQHLDPHHHLTGVSENENIFRFRDVFNVIFEVVHDETFLNILFLFYQKLCFFLFSNNIIMSHCMCVCSSSKIF